MLAGEDQDIISIFVGTWNMGDAPPPSDISSWIQSLGLGKTLPTALAQSHDIYAFGTQVSWVELRKFETTPTTCRVTHDIYIILPFSGDGHH